MRRNKFPLGKILILVTILALPGFLYYLLKAKGKNRYKPLPVFGAKIVASTFQIKRGVKIPDTVYHTINFPEELHNANGNLVKLSKEQHQLTIVNFFYVDNNDVVPGLNKGIKDLQQQFKDNKRIRFVSIGLDPNSDDNKLKAYTEKIGAIPQKWDVITADTAITYPLARDQFFVNAFQTKTGDFVFSDKLILLDAENRIRGYYTGTSSDEIRRISDEIKVLITEELRKIKAEL